MFFAVVIFAAGFFPGLLPLRTGATDGAVLGRANAFAGGLFLGISLLHMLPEADEGWRATVPEFPMAYVIFAFAFLGMLLFEHVVAQGHHHGPAELADELGSHLARGWRYSYALLVALSVHSFVAGMALGTQTVLAQALVVLIAILAHKSTEGFALGVSLARNALPRFQAITLLILFAVATPLGLAVGNAAIASAAGATAERLSAAFLAIAGGTFLYVATLDIMSEEFTHGADRTVKWALATLGVAVTARVAIWI